jgi:prevent-host-death family protein
MSDTWNVHKAKTHLSALIDRALRGEDVVISRANRPVARLVALRPAARARVAGLNASADFWMADDFDAPLPVAFLLGVETRRGRARKRVRGAK